MTYLWQEILVQKIQKQIPVSHFGRRLLEWLVIWFLSMELVVHWHTGLMLRILIFDVVCEKYSMIFSRILSCIRLFYPLVLCSKLMHFTKKSNNAVFHSGCNNEGCLISSWTPSPTTPYCYAAANIMESGTEMNIINCSIGVARMPLNPWSPANTIWLASMISV